MEFTKSNDGKTMDVKLIGEIDSISIKGIEDKLFCETEGVTDLTFDLAQLEYISSAGIRMLLQMQKNMKKQGNMTIKNVSEDILEIFSTTGFDRFFNIV